MWHAFTWRMIIGAALAAVIQIGPAASASDEAINQGMTDERPLKPASNEAIVDYLMKNFWRLRKLAPIPIAVAHNGDSDLDLQTWPGRLIVEKIRSIEVECGLHYRFVSLSDDYRAVLSLGNPGPNLLVSGERSRRDRALSQLRQLLGPTAPILNGQPFTDVENPIYIIDGWYELNRAALAQVLLPFGYYRFMFWEWDERVQALADAIRSNSSRYDSLKRQLFDGLGTLHQACPRYLADFNLRNAHLDVSPDVILQILYDDRIKAGMNRSEFETAARDVLASIRPGQ